MAKAPHTGSQLRGEGATGGISSRADPSPASHTKGRCWSRGEGTPGSVGPLPAGKGKERQLHRHKGRTVALALGTTGTASQATQCCWDLALAMASLDKRLKTGGKNLSQPWCAGSGVGGKQVVGVGGGVDEPHTIGLIKETSICALGKMAACGQNYSLGIDWHRGSCGLALPPLSA